MDDHNPPDQRQGDRGEPLARTIVLRVPATLTVTKEGVWPPPGTRKVVVPYPLDPTDHRPIYIAASDADPPLQDEWKPTFCDTDHSGCRPGQHTRCGLVVWARFPDDVAGRVWIKDWQGERLADLSAHYPPGAAKFAISMASQSDSRMERVAAGISDDEAADWLIVLYGLNRFDPTVEDEVRDAARDRVLGPRKDRPIYPARVRALCRESDENPEELRILLAFLAQREGRAAASVAFGKIPPVTSPGAEALLLELEQRGENIYPTLLKWIELNAAELKRHLNNEIAKLVEGVAFEGVRNQADRAERAVDVLERDRADGPDLDIRPMVHLLMARTSLTDRDREALHLRYWEDLSFAEIGQRLDITENTAIQRHRAAIKKLTATAGP